nr:hypothetical protein [Paraburkholderia sp. BL8N3]
MHHVPNARDDHSTVCCHCRDSERNKRGFPGFAEPADRNSACARPPSALGRGQRGHGRGMTGNVDDYWLLGVLRVQSLNFPKVHILS